MGIESTHAEYDDQIDNWSKIDSVVSEKGVVDYLLPLNKFDTSEENKERNRLYKERAVFYALTKQTVAGLVGTMFAKPPEKEFPTEVEYLLTNVDGRGNSIDQQAKSVAKEIVTKSRAGLFTTFPKTEGSISRADIVNQKYVSTIKKYNPAQILNHAELSVGAKVILTLVTLMDSDDRISDYEVISEPMIRELFIDENGDYAERHWKKDSDGKWEVFIEAFNPTKKDKTKFKEIPFAFIGAEDNDSSVDEPMMLGMANLNIAHFRNSADYEDSVWFTGQVQPWMSGDVDQDYIDLMKDNNMYAGSRNVLAVPLGGQFGFASAPPNPMVRQAMMDKVDMMIGIGARVLQRGGVAKTAEQSGNEKAIQHSPLTLASSNISDAYVRSVKWACEYMGANPSSVKYALNQDYNKINATPQELKEVIAGFMTGAIPPSDYIRYMKEYGLFDEEKEIKDYLDELPAETQGA